MHYTSSPKQLIDESHRHMLDHIVFAATTLDEGVRYFQKQFSVTVPEGGAHPMMGTHNRLMRIGDQAYLEIIAIDRNAPSPQRARWFGLDEQGLQTRLKERPRLVGWVAQTRDIDKTLIAVDPNLGPVISASRGTLRWRITVRDDGRTLEGGTVPLLIQWPEGTAPGPRLPDLGIKLQELRLLHPRPESLVQKLKPLGEEPLVTVGITEHDAPAYLSATFRLPGGKVCHTD